MLRRISPIGQFSTKVKIAVLITATLDLAQFWFLAPIYTVYQQSHPLFANIWFVLDLVVDVFELTLIFPFLRLRKWARKLLITTACYSIFCSVRFLIYSIIGSAALANREALVKMVSDFVGQAVMVIVPLWLIYLLQSEDVLSAFGEAKENNQRAFLLFDQRLPEVELPIRIKRLFSAVIDILFYALIFGGAAGFALLNVVPPFVSKFYSG